MSEPNIVVTSSGPVLTITLNRPKVLNALNAALLAELDAAIASFAADPALRVALLTGAGEKAFAAGADIQELARVSALEGQALSLRGQAIFNRIERCPKPFIACVNGFALGGGCELAMACAFRLASEAARLGQPELKLGLIPGYGGTQRLQRLIGRGAALKLLLTGEAVPAAEALRLGLVDEVCTAAELMPRAQALAATIAAMAPVAVAQCLAAVREGADLPLDAALAHEAAGFGLCCGTEDKAEGAEAFLAKRQTVWKGR
ncbi:enoyl-CoA hydratase-related protein [Acidipila rosea]|uniref:Enoyl-CoA hydratase n=1 Tax=Acidipila rosea TaxID=768535 RepID=A0A4R1L5J9_9BACT|nr:enoyl-CoA hydratase-related protein [Acidipila rosea]TCK71539.1 enoyl-CoA hydratase [Acidipila rosea]